MIFYAYITNLRSFTRYPIFLYLTSISGEVLYSVYSLFIIPIQSISRLYICVIVGSRYINSCPYIRALSIDSPEIQSVLYLQLIRIERSLWIRIQISPWRSRRSRHGAVAAIRGVIYYLCLSLHRPMALSPR